jgi:hypothetical protein
MKNKLIQKNGITNLLSQKDYELFIKNDGIWFGLSGSYEDFLQC